MNDIVIQVENLGKLYRIGSPEDRDKTFREALLDLAQRPFAKSETLSRHPFQTM